MVGLHRVGVVGLRKALEAIDESGLDDRDQIVENMMERLKTENYVPDQQLDAYRLAMWREFLRHRGEDFREFFSEVVVTVRGGPGEERDLLVEMAGQIFAEFELRAIFEFEPPLQEGVPLELLIGEHSIFQGSPNAKRLQVAVRQSLTDW